MQANENGRSSGWRKRIQNAVAVVALVGAAQTLEHRQGLAYADVLQPAAATAQRAATAPNATAAAAVLAGLDAHDFDTQIDISQGSLRNTNRPMDVAIQGCGYYAIKLPGNVGDGVGYTRNGNFFLNNNHELIVGVGAGYSLIPPLIMPPKTTSVSFLPDGTVEVEHGGVKTTVGRLQLALFLNAELLRPLGKNIYLETRASGRATISSPGTDGAGLTEQGFLEELHADPAAKPETASKTQLASKTNS